MSERVEHKIDRTDWPAGPWDGEPDRIEWRHRGFPCLMLRNAYGGWCGYVGVSPEHPLHGVEYNQPSPALETALERRKQTPVGESPGMGVYIALLSGEVRPTPDLALSVHGGITYSNKCSGGICHVPEAGETDDIFWFGFDCGHCDDREPGLAKHYGPAFWREGTYRDVAYVRTEVESLARQLAEIA